MTNDCNTTLIALDVATNRLNWYIALTILATLISIVAIIISTRNNRKSLESINKNHTQQLKANHDWNRRQLALTELMSNRRELIEAIRALNDSINFREQNTSYSLAEIHKALCDEEDHEKHPPLTAKGKEIKHNIFIILNHFEYFAGGIKNKVFSEKIIKDLSKGSLIKANKVFGAYIEHLRSDKHGGNKKVFIEMEELAVRWASEDKKDISSNEMSPTA